MRPSLEQGAFPAVHGLLVSSPNQTKNSKLDDRYCFFLLLFLLIDLREEWGRERKRNNNLLLCLLLQSLVNACMCPNQGLNPQLQRIRIML